MVVPCSVDTSFVGTVRSRRTTTTPSGPSNALVSRWLYDNITVKVRIQHYGQEGVRLYWLVRLTWV